MAAGILIAFFAFVLLGVGAGVAFQVGAAVASGAGAAAATTAAYPAIWLGLFPFFLLAFPFLLILMIAAMARSFYRGRGRGMGWDRRTMFEEWHREAHERVAGKGES